MDTFFPRQIDTPSVQPRPYVWTDFLFLALLVPAIFASAFSDRLSTVFFLCLVLPDVLCGRFSKQRESEASNAAKHAGATTKHIVLGIALGLFALAALVYLDLFQIAETLSSWITRIFDSIPLWVFAPFAFVFFPVYRTADYIEPRKTLCMAYAVAVTALGVAILYL